MTPPMAYKVKITNNYVNAADTNIRIRINAERMRLETIEFFKMLNHKKPLATAQHFDSPAALASHLKYVEDHKHETPF